MPSPPSGSLSACRPGDMGNTLQGAVGEIAIIEPYVIKSERDEETGGEEEMGQETTLPPRMPTSCRTDMRSIPDEDSMAETDGLDRVVAATSEVFGESAPTWRREAVVQRVRGQHA
jgi:hypothetical protein